MKTNLVEEIEKYLNGELNLKEFNEFESRLTHDTEFAREVLLYINIDKAISEIDVLTLRTKMKEVYANLHNHSRFRHDLFKIRWQYLAAAASITVLVTLGMKYIGFSSLTNDEILNKYYTGYEAEGIVRGATETENQDYLDALKAYNDKDFQVSEKLFAKYLEENFSDIQAHFYYGISCFENGNIKDASKSFQLILDHNNNLYLEQSQWYLGLCYLKSYETNKALSVFNSIINEDSTYRDRAREIVRKLK